MSDKKALRRQILDLVREFHAAEPPRPFRPGEDLVRYAGRYFDEKELVNLVDSSLDFWLTAGRYAEEFEARLAEFLGLDERPAGQLRLLGQPRRVLHAHLAQAQGPAGQARATRSSPWPRAFPPRSIPSSRTAPCRSSWMWSWAPMCPRWSESRRRSAPRPRR